MTKRNLPALGPSGGMLDKIRKAKAAVAPAKPAARSKADLLAAALAGVARPRLVFAIDATASREAAWSTARQVTDSLFTALPGELDVALAVHGGSELHTFTGFSSDPAPFRAVAAVIACRAGQTCLVDILDRTREAAGVKVLLYIGDAFEESEEEAFEAARALALRGTRCLLLQEGEDDHARTVFAMIAELTGGALLPFDAAIPDRLNTLLQAAAALAVGGVKLLEAKAKALPAARLLLENLRG